MLTIKAILLPKMDEIDQHQWDCDTGLSKFHLNYALITSRTKCKYYIAMLIVISGLLITLIQISEPTVMQNFITKQRDKGGGRYSSGGGGGGGGGRGGCGRGHRMCAGVKLVLEPNRICRKSGRLKGKQAGICEKEPDIIPEITKGAKMARKECEYQFRNQIWNCTSVRRSMKKILMRDTRETGFVHAITSAGITYTLARACSQGKLLDCSCSIMTSPQSNNVTVHDFDFRGCSDNVEYGYTKSKEFLESSLRIGHDVQTLVLKHNYEAGRLSVKKNMKKACKCHGMSGSCTLQTCWHKLPSFRDVGAILKDKFDGASKVIATNDGRSFTPETNTIKLPSPEDLVYSEESPNFCVADRSTGSLGTRGRECNITSKGVDGCDILCCGRGSLAIRKSVKETCGCRFKWCCEVECEVCTVKKTINTCK